MQFIMLINVKMPTIVGILTFICMIEFEFSKKSLFYSILDFYEQNKFHAGWVEHEKVL